MYVRMYVCMFVCIYSSIYVRVLKRIYTYAYISIYVYVSIYVYHISSRISCMQLFLYSMENVLFSTSVTYEKRLFHDFYLLRSLFVTTKRVGQTFLSSRNSVFYRYLTMIKIRFSLIRLKCLENFLSGQLNVMSVGAINPQQVSHIEILAVFFLFFFLSFFFFRHKIQTYDAREKH